MRYAKSSVRGLLHHPVGHYLQASRPFQRCFMPAFRLTRKIKALTCILYKNEPTQPEDSHHGSHHTTLNDIKSL